MSYRSINAVTRTLTALLTDHLVADPVLQPRFDPGLGGTMRVSARTPSEMDSATQSGLSLWLYRIARDPDLVNQPPRRIGFDRIERPDLPLRLHYLCTPVVNEDIEVGNDPGLEQFIIGKVLQTFHDHPQLAGADLRGDLVGSGQVLSARLESLELEEITRVWDALGTTYQLGVSYEVSMAMVCSDQSAARVRPVDVVEADLGLVVERTGQ